MFFLLTVLEICSQDRWSNEVMNIFEQYCRHGPLVGIVQQYVVGRLHLYLCDTSTDEDVYLHQLLLNRGLASMVQDSEYYQASKVSRNEKKCDYLLTHLRNNFCKVSTIKPS